MESAKTDTGDESHSIFLGYQNVCIFLKLI